MTEKPTIEQRIAANHYVLQNFRESQPDLVPIDDKTLLLAINLWETSSDWPDETKVINWIPAVKQEPSA